MPYLIDGDNLLGTWGRRRTDAERRALAMELQRWGQQARKQVVVVFDGPDPGPPAFGALVHFAGPHSADDLILARVRDKGQAGGWVVVTSDRSLGDQCRWLGAKVERSDIFRHRLNRAAGSEKPEREEDLDFWIEQFGGDDPS